MSTLGVASKMLLYAPVALTGISIWMLVAVTAYFSADIFAAQVRDHVFNNMCPSPLMHRWEDSLIDWCDTWWWHSFRLLTRIIPGVAVASVLVLGARLLLPQKRLAYYFAAVFVMLLILANSYYLSRVSSSGSVALDCMYNRKDWVGQVKVTEEECRRIFGSFGDQRFYFPDVVAVVSLYFFWRRVKTLSARPKKFDDTSHVRGP